MIYWPLQGSKVLTAAIYLYQSDKVLIYFSLHPISTANLSSEVMSRTQMQSDHEKYQTLFDPALDRTNSFKNPSSPEHPSAAAVISRADSEASKCCPGCEDLPAYAVHALPSHLCSKTPCLRPNYGNSCHGVNYSDDERLRHCMHLHHA